MSARPPVVIIGMHRSGTSLLTRVLQDHGFFMGLHTTRNEEAAFTNAVNAWLFREASATWDRPESMDELLADEALRPWLVDYLDGVTRGPAALRFLGLRHGLREGLPSILRRGLHAQQGPWGWKDPRNTWTLPIWQAIFPDLKVLHIVRHGVDVAESLRARRAAVFDARIKRYRRRRALYVNAPWAPKRRGFAPQSPVRRLEAGLSLWARYVERAQTHVAALENSGRALTIRYEDLMATPAPVLQQALTFCGCPFAEDEIERTAARFEPERASAWTQSAELRAFAEAHHDVLARFGYGSAVSGGTACDGGEP